MVETNDERSPHSTPSDPTGVTTPVISALSNIAIMSTPFFEDDWEKVVAATELIESMISPPKLALFEGNWEEVVAAAEQAENAFRPELK